MQSSEEIKPEVTAELIMKQVEALAHGTRELATLAQTVSKLIVGENQQSKQPVNIKAIESAVEPADGFLKEMNHRLLDLHALGREAYDSLYQIAIRFNYSAEDVSPQRATR